MDGLKDTLMWQKGFLTASLIFMHPCIYAWLGQFHWPWPHGRGDAATIVPGDFSRVTRPAGWTRAQLVALPVETADNGKEKGWEYNEYQ